MSILLDWDMPKVCRDCSLQIGGCCQMYSDEEKRLDDIDLTIERPDWCPLIEVPTPHGRLIDADELVRIWKGANIYGNIEPIVNVRPTVIEAEE